MEEEEESEEDDDKDSVIKSSLPAKRKHNEIIEPKIKLKNLCKQILKKVRYQFISNSHCILLQHPTHTDLYVYVQIHSQDAGNGGSMKLKQLKSLIDEQAPSVLSEFSSRKDAIAYLKLKVNAILANLMSNPPTESYAYLYSDKIH